MCSGRAKPMEAKLRRIFLWDCPWCKAPNHEEEFTIYDAIATVGGETGVISLCAKCGAKVKLERP